MLSVCVMWCVILLGCGHLEGTDSGRVRGDGGHLEGTDYGQERGYAIPRAWRGVKETEKREQKRMEED